MVTIAPLTTIPKKVDPQKDIKELLIELKTKKGELKGHFVSSTPSPEEIIQYLEKIQQYSTDIVDLRKKIFGDRDKNKELDDISRGLKADVANTLKALLQAGVDPSIQEDVRTILKKVESKGSESKYAEKPQPGIDKLGTGKTGRKFPPPDRKTEILSDEKLEQVKKTEKQRALDIKKELEEARLEGAGRVRKQIEAMEKLLKNQCGNKAVYRALGPLSRHLLR